MNNEQVFVVQEDKKKTKIDSKKEEYYCIFNL